MLPVVPDGWSEKSSSSAPDDFREWEANSFPLAASILVEEGCSGAVMSLGVALLRSSLLVPQDSCNTLK